MNFKIMNPAALAFAIEESLEHMVKRASERGVKTDKLEISKMIEEAPDSLTADYFKRHMLAGYEVALRVANEKQVNDYEICESSN